MVLKVPESGLLLESSPKAMAGLPTQAFAVSLSNNMIEDMIQCIQSGQDIQLSLGGSPVSFSVPTYLTFKTVPSYCHSPVTSGSGAQQWRTSCRLASYC